MSYYQLPKSNYVLTDKTVKLQVSKKNNPNKIMLNPSLHSYLQESKDLISTHIKSWDTVKKYTNPYEYIHSAYEQGKYVSSIKPLSRAYYKMIELIHTFDIFSGYDDVPIRSFHLAEGPGGFIEAFANMRQNPKDQYYGMTLKKNQDNPDAPGWNKSAAFLKANPNVNVEPFSSGDLYSYDNLLEAGCDCCCDYKHQMDIVTGDGGFDFSVDFSKQEDMALKLIFSQMLFAFTLQKDGGTFILKIFDTFTKPTMDMMFILTCLYDEVYICKPNTSRRANSERYVVCKGFKVDVFTPLRERLMNIFKVYYMSGLKDYIMRSILNIDLNYKFVTVLQEINVIFGQQQLDNINYTLTLIKQSNRRNDKIDALKKKHIQMCIRWCMEHNIPHNEYKKSNIFKHTYK
jgi:23S rRNA U2552 (ribose-2'-O)-methylase RlmE/FtsJ